MKKQFLLIMMALLPMLVSADAVQIGNIWYNLIPKANIAEVTQSPTGYSGDVTIPGTVTHNKIDYIVTSIAENAFKNSNVASVTILNNVTSIGNYAFDASISSSFI